MQTKPRELPKVPRRSLHEWPKHSGLHSHQMYQMREAVHAKGLQGRSSCPQAVENDVREWIL